MKKARVSKQTWPFLRKRTYPNGTEAWMVDARTKSGGERKTFETKAEAETFAQQQRIKRVNEGLSGVAISERLRVEAMGCAERLLPLGATLTEAVDYFMKHAKPASGEKTVKETVAEFLRIKKTSGLRESYLSVQKYVLENVFAGEFGERLVHQVSHTEIEDWMAKKTWGLRTRRNYIRDIGNLFGFAIKRGYTSMNPTARIEQPKPAAKAPGILSPEHAAALLVAAGAGDAAMLPAVAIGLFCGLRSAELQRLDWRHVRFAQKTIEVTAENAKMGERRVVDMPENLLAWILPHAKTAGPVAPPKSFSWRLIDRATAAKIAKWPKNAMRHSFASYHYAHHRNAAATVAQLGHFGDTRTFVNNYRDVVQPDEAAKFWAIMPAADSKVVAMKAA